MPKGGRTLLAVYIVSNAKTKVLKTKTTEGPTEI